MATVTGTTLKQRTFARLIASGARQIDAYNRAYGRRGGKSENSRRVAASQLAARPEFKAAIAEYERESAPIADLRVCTRQMVANLRYLACESPDQRARLGATKHLLDYIEGREQRESALVAKSTVDIGSLLLELTALRDTGERSTDPAEDEQ
jgi:hypothetical protein